MQVKMTVRQIKDIKPVKLLRVPDLFSDKNSDDFDIVFSGTKAYVIDRYNGKTLEYDFESLYPDYPKLVKGLPDDLEIMVDLNVFKHWFEGQK